MRAWVAGEGIGEGRAGRGGVCVCVCGGRGGAGEGEGGGAVDGDGAGRRECGGGMVGSGVWAVDVKVFAGQSLAVGGEVGRTYLHRLARLPSRSATPKSVSTS